MKLEPMNPLPPVTSSFTSLPARHVPDLRARVVPRQPALVAHRWLGREMDVGEVNDPARRRRRSEEHTSELQSLAYLVCRLLLEKKKKKSTHTQPHNTTA